MTLIERVKELRKLRQKAITDLPCPCSTDEINFCCELSNAAPALLDVLECFQPGDAQQMEEMIAAFQDQLITPEPTLEILRRLAEAAKKMEAKQE